ncbi:polyprenyl synthetase family protein [Lacihabitans soyangensis]|uniref:Polyprenyl synthetase family protein n=1 Tax=Lacihabitans soyangensis TaxID=869394 RepID=A0AAE3H194_9BACT|nr:polyprenyl synthetase family protein [Lacihabitans soyangensis]MCP9762792.1 polyprenyl synthetase family protein [Lacihabitans soyangensis]
MPFKSYLEALNKEFENHKYGENPAELYEPISYIMSLGGKRLRPLLTLMSANLWLYNWQKVLKPAMAVEVFHNFTLMHDDIMDQAPLRRGQQTVHEKWNTNTAILSGDVMLVAAYELLGFAEDRHFKLVVKRFNKTAAEVCEGQQLDMVFATKADVKKEDYIEMIRLKTSVLLGFAMELGGILADADEDSVRLLNEIGVNLGLGFQLNDDILDVYADPEKFGKQVGGDIIENKKTWLLLDAIEKAKGTEDGKKLEAWLKKKKFDATEKVEAIRGIYDKFEIRAEAEAEAKKYFEKAAEALNKLAVSEDKKVLIRSFAEQLEKREN